jgi:UV DNA damage endonuclease
MGKLGYACINTVLGSKKILTGRALRKSTLEEKGIIAASELALQNAKDLLTILKWNVENDILFFRLGSDLFPWGNKISVYDFPHFNEIAAILLQCGKFAQKHDIRITAHPGPFNLLASSKEEVVQNTILDLEHHSLVFDLMGLSRTTYNKINIHIGATYGDKEAAAETWCKNFLRLNVTTRSRLTVENDDKASMFSVQDLFDLVYSKVHIPIVFDYHHHKFCPGNLSEKDALNLAISTWDSGITPVVHYSESKCLHVEEDALDSNPRAHSGFVDGPINTYGNDIDIMIEAKNKEAALLRLRKIQPDLDSRYHKKYLEKTIESVSTF